MSATVGGLNTFATQKNIFEYLKANLDFDVVDTEIPDSTTVQRVNGELIPYVVVRFSDSLANGQQQSFGGPRHDGYYGLAQMICVARTGMESLELASAVNNLLIGYTPDANSGPLTKDFGGGSFNIRGVNTSPSFVVSIVAFRFLTNLKID